MRRPAHPARGPARTRPSRWRWAGSAGRAVLGEQGVDVDAVFLGGAGLELLDAQPLLGAHDLVAVHLVGEPGELLDQLAGLRPQGEQLPFADDPGLLGGVAFGDRGCHGLGDAREHLGGGVADGPGDERTAGPGRAHLLLPATRRTLDLGGPQQLIGPAGDRAHPLLAGAHREACLHLGLPRLGHLGLQ